MPSSPSPSRREDTAADEPPDTELVERGRRGELAAFDVLVTRYRGRVYGIIYQMVRNESDAWDLAQDAFVKAWKALPKFEGQSSFFTWLYRISHNVALDWLRARKVQGTVEFDDTLEKSVAAGATTAPGQSTRPDERLSHHELGARLQDALAELSPEHRAVILLREVEGRSYEEIAEIAGCTLGTVMSRLFYARKKLQALLSDVYQSSDWH